MGGAQVGQQRHGVFFKRPCAVQLRGVEKVDEVVGAADALVGVGWAVPIGMPRNT